VFRGHWLLGFIAIYFAFSFKKKTKLLLTPSFENILTFKILPSGINCSSPWRKLMQRANLPLWLCLIFLAHIDNLHLLWQDAAFETLEKDDM